jgi:hypothetical protein
MSASDRVDGNMTEPKRTTARQPSWRPTLHSLLRGAARLMDVSGSMRRRRPASDLEAIAGDWSAVMADFARACASVSAEENTDDEGPDR